jgi:hypothetical protein
VKPGYGRSGAGEKIQQSRFIKDFHTELLRLFEFAAGFFSCYDVIGFVADGTSDLASGRFDLFFGLIAGKCGQCAGEDEGEAFEGGASLTFFRGEGDARGAKTLDEGPDSSC